MKSTTPFAFMANFATGTIVNALAIPPSGSINTDNVVDITGDETSLAANNASDIELYASCSSPDEDECCLGCLGDLFGGTCTIAEYVL
ncbi:hypothetical protein SUNI508_12783 [Seiridium unicorne]|uniref:Uncharacterized protein n=1 Tax=Seiridium unicorne TaxID=138068 RepID=A0ABR2VG32_9PEZI